MMPRFIMPRHDTDEPIHDMDGDLTLLDAMHQNNHARTFAVLIRELNNGVHPLTVLDQMNPHDRAQHYSNVQVLLSTMYLVNGMTPMHTLPAMDGDVCISELYHCADDHDRSDWFAQWDVQGVRINEEAAINAWMNGKLQNGAHIHG